MLAEQTAAASDFAVSAGHVPENVSNGSSRRNSGLSNESNTNNNDSSFSNDTIRHPEVTAVTKLRIATAPIENEERNQSERLN